MDQNVYFKIEHDDTLIVAPALHHSSQLSISTVDQIITKILPVEQFPVLSQKIQHIVVGEGNRLSSFTGIQLFENLESFHVKENIFRSLDERSGVNCLAKLTQLKVLDLSDNNISRVNLVPPSSSSFKSNNDDDRSTSAGGLQVFMPNNIGKSSSSSSSFNNLSRLVLSGNVLSEIPNLRQLHNLQDLRLDNNQLATLSGIEFNLPASIQIFIVDNNQIAHWPCLVELAPFADSLHEFSINGNPVMDITLNMPEVNQRFELRLFLALLLPALHTLNGKAIADSEQTRISEAWDCMTGSQLLAPGNSDTLAQFLHKFFPPPSSSSSSTSQQPQQQEKPSANTDGQNNNNEMYDKTFSKINSRIDKIVEVVRALRRDDLIVRNKAATLIQKTFRGCFVRVKLSKQYSNYKQWRNRILRSQQSARGKRVIDVVFPRQNANTPTSSVVLQQQQKQYEEHQGKLQQQVTQLQSAMKTLWNDMAHMRGFLNAQRAAAARVIQTFWRGYKARRKFKRVRDEFRRFASKFTPSVIKIQATFRMFFQRRRFLVSIQKERRVTSLENEVSTLKQQVADLCKAFSLIKPSTTLATASSPQPSHQHYSTNSSPSSMMTTTFSQPRNNNISNNDLAYRTASTTDGNIYQDLRQRSASNTSNNNQNNINNNYHGINQIATSPHSRENSVPVQQQPRQSSTSYFAGNYAPVPSSSSTTGLDVLSSKSVNQQQSKAKDEEANPSYVGFTISPSSANSVMAMRGNTNSNNINSRASSHFDSENHQSQQMVSSPFGIVSSTSPPSQQNHVTPSSNKSEKIIAAATSSNSSSSIASKKLLMMTTKLSNQQQQVGAGSTNNDFDNEGFDDFSPSTLEQYSSKVASSVPQNHEHVSTDRRSQQQPHPHHHHHDEDFLEEGSPSPFGMRVI